MSVKSNGFLSYLLQKIFLDFMRILSYIFLELEQRGLIQIAFPHAKVFHSYKSLQAYSLF